VEKAGLLKKKQHCQQLLAQGAPRPVIAKTLQRTVAAIEGRLNIIRSRNELSAPNETKVWYRYASRSQVSVRTDRPEYSRWRAVPEDQRSPASAWWWQPAFEVREQLEEMSPILCHQLEIPVGSPYAAGSAVLLGALADQTSLPWPDEFPFKIERGEASKKKPWKASAFASWGLSENAWRIYLGGRNVLSTHSKPYSREMLARKVRQVMAKQS
jgi:hypothetical protein